MRKADADGQPDWFRDGVARGRYPMLWEAVLTAIDPEGLRSLGEHLADHVNHLLINTMQHRVASRVDHIPQLDHGVRPSHAQPSQLIVAGQEVPGLTIDTDPDIVCWATQIADTFITIGLPREKADTVTVALEQFETSAPAALGR